MKKNIKTLTFNEIINAANEYLAEYSNIKNIDNNTFKLNVGIKYDIIEFLNKRFDEDYDMTNKSSDEFKQYVYNYFTKHYSTIRGDIDYVTEKYGYINNKLRFEWYQLSLTRYEVNTGLFLTTKNKLTYMEYAIEFDIKFSKKNGLRFDKKKRPISQTYMRFLSDSFYDGESYDKDKLYLNEANKYVEEAKARGYENLTIREVMRGDYSGSRTKYYFEVCVTYRSHKWTNKHAVGRYSATSKDTMNTPLIELENAFIDEDED